MGMDSESTDLNTGDLYAVADFCLIPIGTDSTSVAEYVAECARVLQKTELRFRMHGYGTNIEGPWSQVSKAIHDCHVAVHVKGAGRIATDIRIGTRTDRVVAVGAANDAKLARVEEILSQEGMSAYSKF